MDTTKKFLIQLMGDISEKDKEKSFKFKLK